MLDIEQAPQTDCMHCQNWQGRTETQAARPSTSIDAPRPPVAKRALTPPACAAEAIFGPFSRQSPPLLLSAPSSPEPSAAPSLSSPRFFTSSLLSLRLRSAKNILAPILPGLLTGLCAAWSQRAQMLPVKLGPAYYREPRARVVLLQLRRQKRQEGVMWWTRGAAFTKDTPGCWGAVYTKVELPAQGGRGQEL